jgi:hypothetical protein
MYDSHTAESKLQKQTYLENFSSFIVLFFTRSTKKTKHKTKLETPKIASYLPTQLTNILEAMKFHHTRGGRS